MRTELREKPYVDGESGFVFCEREYIDELFYDSNCELLDKKNRTWNSLCPLYLGDDCPFWNER